MSPHDAHPARPARGEHAAIGPRDANLLAAAAVLVGDRVERGLAAVGLAPSAAAALATISHFPGEPIDRLRIALQVTHSGAVRLVDRLEADGLVERRRHGREVAVRLTPRGRAVLRRAEAARLAAAAEVLEPLDPGARAAFTEALAGVLGGASHTDDDLRRICRLCSYGACEGEPRCPVAASVDAAR